MAASNIKYILWIAIISLLSTCNSLNDGSCPNRDFYNWLGNKYSVSSTEVCTSRDPIFNLCITSKCKPSTNIYDAAKKSSGWTVSSCYSYKSGSKASDDMKCSNPNPDPVHEELFKDICKTHDLCLKTNGRTASKCNDEFYFNMQQRCKMQYPDADTAAVRTNCLAAANFWHDSVNLAAKHRGGIDSKKCKPAPKKKKTLSVYCDNSCIVYRSDRSYKPWKAKRKIGSISNWMNPLEINIANIKKTTTIFVKVKDNGVVGGFMGCMYFKQKIGSRSFMKTECTRKSGGYWKAIYSSTGGAANLVATKKGAGAWGNRMKPSSGIPNNAYWLWAKGKTNNVMIFRFQFKDVIAGDDQPIIDGDTDNDDNGDYNVYYMDPPQDDEPFDFDTNPVIDPPQQNIPQIPEEPINIKPAPVSNIPSYETPSNAIKIDWSNSWFSIIGMILFIMLSFNICLIYSTGCCSKQKNKYSSVKAVDSEFYESEENIAINA